MSSCRGRGDCIKQCGCICYDDEECEIISEICKCGHRYHDKMIGGNSDCQLYCKDTCSYNCELVECHNYRICKQKLPQILLDCHNNMCIDCAINIGKITFLNKNDTCPICLNDKEVIQISCGKHTFCFDCWKNWSENSIVSPLSCPLCRKSIWER